MAPPLWGLEAREWSVVSSLAGLPVAASSLRSLMPDQKDPKASQGVQVSSNVTLGSMALKLSVVFDSMTRPSSTQLGVASDAVVARPITELLDPKVEPA